MKNIEILNSVIKKLFWFLKLSVNNENAHLMRFVEKYNATSQGVSLEDKIPFEEYH